MKIKRILPVVFAVLLLWGSVLVVSKTQTRPVAGTSSDDELQKSEQMRGLWVTYMTLDVEKAADKEQAFKDKIDAVIADMKALHLNTMIVQVRPFGDALYHSRLFPWSHILSGTQGKDPGYDPLRYICEQCHANALLVHAWVNPYRIKTAETPHELSEDNPYIKDQSIGFELNGAVCLDPANEKARQLIVDGVREIVEQYDVDGVQFDDYFYPEGMDDLDAGAYRVYCEQTASPLSLSDWRMENVNLLIKSVYQAVHKADDNVVFGISPQGNLGNNQALGADVKRWCRDEGYIDYICPQLYFSLDNPALRFEDALAEWEALEKHIGLSLCIGLACYKAGSDSDSGTWQDNHDILKTELQIISSHKLGGFILYSYDSINSDEAAEEMAQVKDYLTNSPSQ